MSEPTDYMALMQSVEPLGIRKYGYRVELTQDNNYINIQILYQETRLGRYGVHLIDGNGRRRKFEAIVEDLKAHAMNAYNRHNETFQHPDLLKALEDSLNGPAEMIVLQSAPSEVEDEPSGFVVATDVGVVPLEHAERFFKHSVQ